MSTEQTARDEEALMGGLLVKPDSIYQAIEYVEAKDFADHALGLLFSTMQTLLRAGVPLDGNNVLLELKRAGLLGRIGAARYAALVQNGLPHHVRFYSEQVAKHSQIRRLRVLVASLQDELKQPDADAADIAEKIQLALIDAAVVRADDVDSAGRICMDELDRLELLRTAGESGVLATGIPCIDRALGGGLPKGVTVLAARPSIGKSALALEIACRVAARNEPALFVSIEMSRQQNAHRLLSRQAKLSIGSIQGAGYADSDVPRLLKASSELNELPLRIWQASGATASRIESMLRLHKARHGLRLAVIDYLGLVHAAVSRSSIYEQTTANSHAFATMAKRLDLPILLLAQLNRGAEGERPELHHLRDSGAIEQDADVVAFLHRDQRDSQEADFILAKQRQGKIQAARLRFDQGRFFDPTESFTNDFANHATGV
jgi:replicative DNA helicase